MSLNKLDGKAIYQIFGFMTLFSILIITLFYLTIFRGEVTFKIAVILSILSTILCYILIFINKSILNFGVFTMLFTYFTLTHFGASTVYLLSPESLYINYRPHQYTWLYSDEVILAILYCILAQIIFLLSRVIFGVRLPRKKGSIQGTQNKSLWIPRIGFICVFIVLLYFLFNAAVGNFSLESTYSEFRSWRSESAFFTMAIFLLATGYIMVIATGSKKQIILINIMYLLVGIILFLTGNKGEVLYAILAATGVYYSRVRKISKKIIFSGLIVFFVIIPFITSTRSSSIINSINQIGLNFTGPFLEIGWQLRTVEKVIHWLGTGESLGYGISYFAPVERIVSTVTLGIIPEIPITGVPWSFGERLPGWGFSQVAESIYNFSLFGPIIFYLFLGWFLTKAESQNNSVYINASYSAIVVILMILTRNRFSFVPGQIIMAVMLVFIAYILDGNFKKRISKNKGIHG